MDLREFVKRSLVDIAAGINDANAALTEERGKSHELGGRWFRLRREEGGLRADRIEFDIAVTLTSGAADSKGAGLRLSVVEFGMGKGKSSGTESISRIKFSVEAEANIG